MAIVRVRVHVCVCCLYECVCTYVFAECVFALTWVCVLCLCGVCVCGYVNTGGRNGIIGHESVGRARNWKPLHFVLAIQGVIT